MTVRSIFRDSVGGLLHLLGLTHPRRRARGKLAVVTFHRVLPAELRAQYPLPGLCVTPQELRWYLEFFQQSFSCGSLRHCAEQMQNNTTLGKPLLAITFDDAQEDNFRFAKEVLDAFDMRATFFVPTCSVETGEPLWHDRVGFSLMLVSKMHKDGAKELLEELNPALKVLKPGASLEPTHLKEVMASLKSLSDSDRQRWMSKLEESIKDSAVPDWAGMMSWEQVQILDRAGHEIGSHSVNHPILPNCDLEQIAQEVRASKKIIEEKLGKRVESFCYPNGDWSEAVVKAVKEAGYERAVTTQWGANDGSGSAYTLRRFDMCAEHIQTDRGKLSASRLAWRMSGFYPGLG